MVVTVMLTFTSRQLNHYTANEENHDGNARLILTAVRKDALRMIFSHSSQAVITTYWSTLIVHLLT